METTMRTKIALDELSKEDVITKYKSVLNLAKKAKIAKEELTEENKKLKEKLSSYELNQEGDKKSLVAMQEIITNFTENKLKLTNEIVELKTQRKIDMERLENLSIENENIKKRLLHFTQENEALLQNLQHLEKQLQQVNEVGQEQKCGLILLEEQINKLKNVESTNEQLLYDNAQANITLEILKEKYKLVKEINLEQKVKFNSLKERFIDVHRKLKKLKECKKVLLETQYEYAESVNQWQEQIVNASKLLCQEFNLLQMENAQLLSTQTTASIYKHNHNYGNSFLMKKLNNIIDLCNKAVQEQKQLRNNMLQLYNYPRELLVLKINEISQLGSKALEEQEQMKREYSNLCSILNRPINNRQIFIKIQNVMQSYDKVLKEQEKSTIEEYSLNRSREFESDLQMEQENNISVQNRQMVLSTKQKKFEYNSLINENFKLNEMLNRKNEDYAELLTRLHENIDKCKRLENELCIQETNVTEKEEQFKSLQVEIEDVRKNLKHYENVYLQEVEKVRESNKNLEIMQKSNNFHNVNNNEHLIIENLNEKLRQLVAVKDDLEGQLKKKQTEFENLEKQYKEVRKCMNALKSENHKLLNSRKQTNVLNLEIEAAERSLKEVADKLNSRNNELNELKDVLASTEEKNRLLRQEIESLEAAKTVELNHSIELKEQIDQLKQNLKDAIRDKQMACDNNKCLQIEMDKLRSELEGIHLQLANITAEYEKSITNLKSDNKNLNRQLNCTEEELNVVNYKLSAAERNIKDLKDEFSEYKIKAQNVLKRNQTRDLSKEKELEEELIILKQAKERYKQTVETLNNKLEKMKQEVKLLQSDNENFQKRNEILMTSMEELRQNNDSLSKEIQHHVQQHHDTLKQHSLQLNTIDECHKEQLLTLQQSYERQLEQLKSIQEVKECNKCVPQVESELLFGCNQLRNTQNKIDFILMEREDGEGSEEGDLEAISKRSVQQSSSHEFMPLDELLNTPINDINTETLITNESMIKNKYNNKVSSATAADSDICISGAKNNSLHILRMELNNAKERLQKQEGRVRHLTILLAENEQDLAKLTQMNDMLKEELRRQERSVEREHHMHNSEYLKNVLMKFLTLNHGDEKLRLIPVLNTILKLSPNEIEILNCVAKGQRVNIDSNQRSYVSSWGNFLTSWTNYNNT